MVADRGSIRAHALQNENNRLYTTELYHTWKRHTAFLLYNPLTNRGDWLSPVVHNTYCFIIARKNDILHLPINSNTN